MAQIELDVKVRDTVRVNVEVEYVVAALNELPMTHRWNYIATMIQSLETDLDDLTDNQRSVVKGYLERKIKLFKEDMDEK